MTSEEAQKAMLQTLGHLASLVDDVHISLRKENFTVPARGHVKYSLEFRGGDYKYQTRDLDGMGAANSAKHLEDWQDSLSLQPMMLETDLELRPIIKAAERVSPAASIKIDAALSALFNATLKITQTAVSPVPPERAFTETIQTIVHKYNIQTENIIKTLLKDSSDRTAALMKWFDEREARSERKISENDAYNKLFVKGLKDEIQKLKNRTCLRAGTLILMSDWSQKRVEDVVAGDWVLDHELQPSRVLAALSWYLGAQEHFYGFGSESASEQGYFTETHPFVGPQNKMYVVSVEKTLQTTWMGTSRS
jgi:hypothetical protein